MKHSLMDVKENNQYVYFVFTHFREHRGATGGGDTPPSLLQSLKMI
jgi:hypothetical protein